MGSNPTPSANHWSVLPGRSVAGGPNPVSATEVSERLWERAFQLSYFILLDRPEACECVARAVEKLAAQQSREKRRAYWRGRKKELTIRRISRPAQDTLQWLICLESEVCEKEQELRGQPSEADMVVRYVKHLAQMTTGSSSFHVNIGFNRLLRNYTTPEVQQIYELATGRFPASEEYRKAKGKLLKQLAARFERYLRIRAAEYGELQFETHKEREPWSRLVDECVDFFAPWSGRESCLRDGGALLLAVPPGRQAGGSPSSPDRLETSRCHWFMHSGCYGRLAQKLGFGPPQERLCVPRFLHRDGGGQGSDPGSPERRTAPLSTQESEILRERRGSVIAARGALALLPLKIVAHGTVCARLDPARDERRGFEIPAGTRLLEVRSDTTGSDRILATHWVDYSAGQRFVAAEYSIPLQGRRQLVLNILPTSEAGEEQGADGAVVTIESCAAAALVERLGERLRSVGALFGDRSTFLRPALVSLALVTVGVLASGAYFGLRVLQDRRIIGRMAAEVAAQRAVIAALEQRAPNPSAQLPAHYAFSSDAPNLRGTGNQGEPVVTFAPAQSMVILELPIAGGEHALYSVKLSSFPEEQERLTETALRPVRNGNRWFVEFSLPAVLVQSNTHYLLALTQMSGADSGRYLFQVRKPGAGEIVR